MIESVTSQTELVMSLVLRFVRGRDVLKAGQVCIIPTHQGNSVYLCRNLLIYIFYSKDSDMDLVIIDQ